MPDDNPPLSPLIALVDRLRPDATSDLAAIEANFSRESARLAAQPDEAGKIAAALDALLLLPRQTAFLAETGVRSALGFTLELSQRIGERLLPAAPDSTQLRDLLGRIFRRRHDHEWLAIVPEACWRRLLEALAYTPSPAAAATATANLLEAIRVLSYRLAGGALDRELLRADPALELYESPFLAQNAALLPILERVRNGGARPTPDEVRDIDVLLEQCGAALDRARRRAGEHGISVRLTYHLARLRQLLDRLRRLLDLSAAGSDRSLDAIGLLRILVGGKEHRRRILAFIGENVSLIARNVTDHASRHGEHYIAGDRAEWWAMGRSAAGGGIIIAAMAMLKIQLALLHLPPLTEGIAFGLNYALGFVLIHLLGFTVATKQPAMTAAAIAATLEEARPRELERLGDLAQNVVRTQFVAVLGNVGLAFPVACLIAFGWVRLFGSPPAPAEKLLQMLLEVHPLHSGALFYAAVAGVGLFLSGLASGYFDNQARYHRLAERIAAAPLLAWLGPERAQRFGDYLDAHYGAILGNFLFGMYLGLVGASNHLTGLPLDIRHVAFASANLGTALTLADWPTIARLVPWAVAGVIGIALVNLAVSFTLALYVAMKSRRLGSGQILRLAALLLGRFARRPFAFFRAPQG